MANVLCQDRYDLFHFSYNEYCVSPNWVYSVHGCQCLYRWIYRYLSDKYLVFRSLSSVFLLNHNWSAFTLLFTVTPNVFLSTIWYDQTVRLGWKEYHKEQNRKTVTNFDKKDPGFIKVTSLLLPRVWYFSSEDRTVEGDFNKVHYSFSCKINLNE